MEPHRIRLREPWDESPTGEGGVRRRRAFHLPTGLAAGDVVRLVIEGAEGLQTVTVNDQPQAVRQKRDVAACDITAVLQPRNQIELRLTAGGGVGEVRLEIEAAQ